MIGIGTGEGDTTLIGVKAVIEFRDVSKVYENGTHALNHVNIKINKGEFVFVVGASGAGKSTFLKLMMREEVPSHGKIIIKNQDLSSLSRREIPYFRRGLGIVFQDFRLIPKMTVYDNVAFAMRVIGAKENKIKKRVPFVLETVGLKDKMDCYPNELSGGEQQRVALARALTNNADLIIADEPTGNVDPRMSLEIVDLLMRLNSEGTTVIMVTHEHSLVRMYDKRVILLENGTVAADGRMKNSAHREVKLSGGIGRPADGFATKYLDDEDDGNSTPNGGSADKAPAPEVKEKLSANNEELSNESAINDEYMRAVEELANSQEKQQAAYGSEYDDSYSRILESYSIYLEDQQGGESDEG